MALELKLALLGILQGLTEFLPVSSSGHLTLAQNLQLAEQLFGLSTPDGQQVIIAVVMHVGTLTGVLVAFRDDIGKLLTCWFASPGDWGEAEELEVAETRYSQDDLSKITRSGDEQEGAPPNDPVVATRRMFWLLAAGTVPLFAALPFRDFFERLANDPDLVWVTGAALLVTGAFNIALDFFDRIAVSDASLMGYGRALLVGLFQVMAIVPGLSRSGSTIFAGVLSGINREQAARYSFLLSTIAILGAALLTARDIGSLANSSPVALGVGFLASAVSGYLAIIWLLGLLERKLMRWLGVYTLLLGGLTLWLTLGN